MGKFAAAVSTAYVFAGLVLFLTNEAPVIASGVDFLGDSFSVAWAGWKFSGCLYMALVNWGFHLGTCSALAMIPYIAFDVYALSDTAHWTSLAAAFIVLEVITALAAMAGKYKVGGAINLLYVCAGIALFSTGTAPVLTPSTNFLGDPFAMAWAGWKFSGCLYFALINLGVDKDLSMIITMLPYLAFDVLAFQDPAHWTKLSVGFLVLDGAMGVLGLKAFIVAQPKPSRKAA